MKQNSNDQFSGTDWLKLETAIELIGDLIALNTMRLDNALKSNSSDEIIIGIENELKQLIRERQQCYDVNSNNEVLIKVFSVYVPKLKKEMSDFNLNSSLT